MDSLDLFDSAVLLENKPRYTFLQKESAIGTTGRTKSQPWPEDDGN